MINEAYLKIRIITLSALLLNSQALSASFATSPSIPGAVMPEQVDRALSMPLKTKFRAHPFSHAFIPAEKTTFPTSEQAKKLTFKLNAIQLEGNHVFSTEQLAPLYQDKLGKVISVSDLFTIVQTITNFYRNNGYIISRAIVPPQAIKGGVVKVQVIEGKIATVNIVGHPHKAKFILQIYGDQIKKSQPLKINNLEKYLFLANELPSTQVRAILGPSQTTVGASDLTLVTTNTPISGYFSYDNYGNRYIGPQQFTTNIGLNSFARSGDLAQFTYVKTAKGGELTFFDANYATPIGTHGLRGSLGGTLTHTHPLFALTPVQMTGETESYYTTLQYPLIRTHSQSLTIQGGANYLDSAVNTFSFPFYTDHIRSVNITGIYNFLDRWEGTNLVSLDFNKGLPLAGYTSNSDPNTALTSRPGATGNYLKFNLQAVRMQRFNFNSRLSIYGLLKGQWTPNSLLSFEQFSVGGSQLGRGYDVAEIIGDKGAAGTLEIRYDIGYGRFYLQSLQLYGFYDAGVVWDFKHLGTTPTRQTATSAGIGSRIFFTKNLSGNLMFAQPLSKQVAAEELIGRGKCPRIFFSIAASSS